jgi:hypothetical protein
MLTTSSFHNNSSSSLISRNRSFCDAAVKATMSAAQSGIYEQALSWANVAGLLCWNMHPGYYAHPPLERALQLIASQLVSVGSLKPLPLPARRKGARTCLHVLTVALSVGGHTRLVERMMLNTAAETGEQHLVMVLDQADVEFPEWLRDAAEHTGGAAIVIPSAIGLAEKAIMLRKIARDWADTVFLHTHPSDPIPTASFGVPGGPPVVLVNHADHVFWLGGGAVDLVSDIRLEGQQLTLQRRGGLKSAILPIPLAPPELLIDRKKARSGLGIDENTVVLLAIASSYKFSPSAALDFPKYASEILSRHTNSILLVIGPSETDPCWRDSLDGSDGRLHLLGIRKEIENYYAAADIFLESYPVGSLTSTLDAMLRGVPVVRAPALTPPILVISEYDGMQRPATDYAEYLAQASALIQDVAYRRLAGERQRDSALARHAGSGWNNAWKCLIESLPSVHAPTVLHNARCLNSIESLDRLWAEMQSMQNEGKPDIVSIFKTYVRERFRWCSRNQLFSMWRSAVLRGNWKVARVFLTDITKRSGKK